MNSFFRTIVRTVWDPRWYQEIRTQRTQVAIVFFLKVAVILTAIVVVAGWSVGLTLVNFERNTPQYLNDLVAKYPAELKVTIHDGHASSNVKEPYFVALPNGKSANDGNITNLVVIDTQTPFSSDQFAKYHAVAWLGSDSLYYYNHYDSNDRTVTSQVEVLSLKNVPNATIDRSFIHDNLQRIIPWARVLVPVAAVFLVGFIYVAMLVHLIYFLVLALVVMFLAWLVRRRINNYGAAYRVALYGATVPLIVSTLANVTPYHLPVFSVTILALLIVVVNLTQTDQAEAPKSSSPSDSTNTPQ